MTHEIASRSFANHLRVPAERAFASGLRSKPFAVSFLFGRGLKQRESANQGEKAIESHSMVISPLRRHISTLGISAKLMGKARERP